MDFKPFNIHRFTNRPTKAKFRGFTAIVAPSTNDPRKVRVTMTFCSSKDMYCRKTGVKMALDKPMEDFECNARDTLKTVQEKVDHYMAHRGAFGIKYEEWLYKYFF